MVQTIRLTSQQIRRLQSAEPSSLSARAANKVLINLLLNVDEPILNAAMEETVFAEGEIVFREGDAADACFLIQDGRVAVVIGDIDAPVAVLHREPGEMVGEMALLDEQPRSASILALEETHLLRIKRNDFEHLIEIDPAITKKLLSMLSYRLRNAHTINTANVRRRKNLSTQLSQLTEENEFLQELQRARQETTDLIVHDLRNPLANLYGTLKMLEIVLPPDLLEKHRELMSIAGLAYERMRRLVDSLLDMRGMESGERELELTAVDMCVLVKESVRLASFIVEKRQIQVNMHMPEKQALVLVDEEMLRRVLANLIDNALKHLPEKGVLTLQVQSLEMYLQVSVMDNGPGIPEEDRERIFRPFAQTDKERKQRRGYGLGLTFSYQAIEAHNGRIWVEAGDHGVGSKFVFTLPF